MTTPPSPPIASPAVNPVPLNAATLLLPYQRAWFNDAAPVRVVEASRRIGKTFALAAEAVFDRLTGARTVDLWYSGSDESGAREFMMEVRELCQQIGTIVEIATGEELFDTGGSIKTFSVAIPLPEGCKRTHARITAMASSPKALRGKGGDVVLDEFAHHNDDVELYRAATPVTTWGGRLTVISTHNGDNTMFARLCDMGLRRRDPETFGTPRAGDVPVSLHTVTIHDAVNAGLVERINARQGTSKTREEFIAHLRGIAGDELTWQQEYECKRIADNTAWLPMALLRSRTIRDHDHELLAQPTDQPADFVARAKHLLELIEGDRCTIGIDIGRKKDLTAIWALGWSGNPNTARKTTLGLLTMRNTAFGSQARVIDQIVAALRPRRVCIDATGLGMQLAEQAIERHGKHIVEAVTFTSAVKDDLAGTVRRSFEDDLVAIPDDSDTLADLGSIRVAYSSAGNPRYDANASELGHADRFWALALALHAAEAKHGSARFVETVGGVCP